MNTPTRHAPHIWWNVRRKISPIWAPLSLPCASRSSATMIQEARIAVPPTYGANLKAAVTAGFAALHVAPRDEQATACAVNHVTFGSGDQGPVQAATTISRTTKGIHA